MYLPNAFGTTFDPVFIENTVEPAIGVISTQGAVPLIDNDTPLINRPDYFTDGVHPTVTGAGIIAQQVANALAGGSAGDDNAPFQTGGTPFTRFAFCFCSPPSIMDSHGMTAIAGLVSCRTRKPKK
jgi:hypothetical protein